MGELADVVRGVTYQSRTPGARQDPDCSRCCAPPISSDRLDLDGELDFVPVARCEARTDAPGRGPGPGGVEWFDLGRLVRAHGWIKPWEGTFGAFCTVVRPGNRVLHRFLGLYLASDAVRRRWSAAAPRHQHQQPQTRRHRLITPVPVPPLDEQRRIVDTLEDHLSRLDQAERNLVSANVRRRALVQASLDVTTRAYADADDHAGMPSSTHVEAGRSFAAEHRSAQGDEWGVIKVSAMTWGAFRPEENKAVLDPARIDPRYEIEVGDVLVSRANTTEYVGAPVSGPTKPLPVGFSATRACVWSHGLASTRHGCTGSCQHRPARRQMSQRATGTKDSMRNISQASLLSIEVPLAGDKGQRAVIEEADLLDLGVGRSGQGPGRGKGPSPDVCVARS